MHTFRMTFGMSLAQQVDHTGNATITSIDAHHYSKDVEYQPEKLTEKARLFIDWSNGRDLYPQRVAEPARLSNHPDANTRACYAGTDPEFEFVKQPHANHASDLYDCTEWLNKMAEKSGYFDQ